jgi:cell division protein ZapA
MPLVNVVVNDRSYAIQCDEGEEDHLRQLSQELDRRVRALAGSVGQAGDTRLILMTALVALDELADARRELAALKGKGGAPRGSEDSLAELLENATSRLEAIAARMTGS